MTVQRDIMVVFGTRPEAIKLAPLVLALRASDKFNCIAVSTGQHGHMVKPVTDFFGFSIDHDLGVMKPNQSLNYLASSIIAAMSALIEARKPAYVVVQGDTSTTFAAAMAAFNCNVPVVHIEAGLRTGDIKSPWPEEANRVLTSKIADLHFPPTELAAQNLRHEAVPSERIFNVGNTVVDAALAAANIIAGDPERLAQRFPVTQTIKPLILFTMHRRESFGKPMRDAFGALRDFALANDVEIIFPVHPNPNVRAPATELLSDVVNIHMCDPLEYDELIYLLKNCRFVITDSGGIVEEAAAFSKPALVLRETTERTESVDAGAAVLCGTDREKILPLAMELLSDGSKYRAMSTAPNPFGNGTSCAQIVNILAKRG
jgi:UDP-N-acetylglucosamine 2-epimerase (non-hydrolysing)